MAAPDFIAAATPGKTDGTNTVAVTIPTSGPGGSVVADQRILLCLTGSPSAPTGAPSGFTLEADTTAAGTNSGGHAWWWTSTVDATGAVNAGDTVTVTLDGNARATLTLHVYEECDITDFVVSTPGGSGNTDFTLTTPAATADDESRAVHFYGILGNVGAEQPTWVAHASTTERSDITSTHASSRNATQMVADEVIATAGAVAGRVATSSVRVQPTSATFVLSVAVDRPTVSAGTDQIVGAGDGFTLTATPAAGAGAPYTYAWTQTAGTTTALSSTTVASPTATAGSQSETLTYSVVATDTASVASFADTVNITVVGASDTALPIVDVTTSGWTKEPTGAVSFAATLNDANDATYIQYATPVGTVVFEGELSALNEQTDDEPYTVSYRPQLISGTTATIIVRLKQGASTVIASWTDTWTTNSVVQQFDHALTQGQVDSITDWDDLRLRFEVTAS